MLASVCIRVRACARVAGRRSKKKRGRGAGKETEWRRSKSEKKSDKGNAGEK